MLAGQRGDAIIDLGPDFRRHHRFERRVRDLEGEVALAHMAGVDDFASGAVRRRRPGNRATVSIGFCVAESPIRCSFPPDRFCNRSSDSERCAPRLFGAKAWISSTMTDARRRQHLAAGFGAEQDVERFRGGDDDMGRPAAHLAALRRRRVAGAHPGPDVDVGQPLRLQRGANPGQRRFEVALDVVRQGFERRDVDDLRLIGQDALQSLPHQANRWRRGRRRKSCPTRSAPRSTRPARPLSGPGARLRFRWRAEGVTKPGDDSGVKQVRVRHDFRNSTTERLTRASVVDRKRDPECQVKPGRLRALRPSEPRASSVLSKLHGPTPAKKMYRKTKQYRIAASPPFTAG